MLTPSEIESLRRGVEAAQRRPITGPWEWATCIDGPLAGITVRLEPWVAHNPNAIFGWCQTTETGPVSAQYRQSGVPGQWRFEGYSAPGRRESGRAVA